MSTSNDREFQQLIAKVESLRSSGSYDLSTDEDLSLAVMNLISLEEHFFFTSQKTHKSEYLNLLAQTRDMRKRLLAKLIPQNEGETWCVSKHLLATTMRLMEVGTKLQSAGKAEESSRFFADAYKIYSLFWALRLKLISISGLTKKPEASASAWTYEDIVTKLVDCCRE